MSELLQEKTRFAPMEFCVVQEKLSGTPDEMVEPVLAVAPPEFSGVNCCAVFAPTVTGTIAACVESYSVGLAPGRMRMAVVVAALLSLKMTMVVELVGARSDGNAGVSQGSGVMPSGPVYRRPGWHWSWRLVPDTSGAVQETKRGEPDIGEDVEVNALAMGFGEVPTVIDVWVMAPS